MHMHKYILQLSCTLTEMLHTHNRCLYVYTQKWHTSKWKYFFLILLWVLTLAGWKLKTKIEKGEKKRRTNTEKDIHWWHPCEKVSDYLNYISFSLHPLKVAGFVRFPFFFVFAWKCIRIALLACMPMYPRACILHSCATMYINIPTHSVPTGISRNLQKYTLLYAVLGPLLKKGM